MGTRSGRVIFLNRPAIASMMDTSSSLLFPMRYPASIKRMISRVSDTDREDEQAEDKSAYNADRPAGILINPIAYKLEDIHDITPSAVQHTPTSGCQS